MRKSFLLAAMVAAAGVPTFAAAGVLVLGNGMARSCYLQAERGASDGITLQTCNKALREESLSPRDRAATYVNRGVVLLRRGSYAAAVKDFDDAIAITPGQGEAWVNRGSAKVGLHQYEEALSDLDKGLQLGAREPEKAWYNKGLALEAMGDTKGAYLAFKRAVQLRPDWPLAQNQLARFTVKKAG